MDSKKSREIILAKIKKSMEEGRNFPIPPHDYNSPVFPVPDDLLNTFESELTTIGGKVNICESQEEISEAFASWCEENKVDSVFCIDPEIQSQLAHTSIQTHSKENHFKDMQVGITRCEYLVSRTGSIVISAQHPSGRRLNVFPPVHVVFAKASQLVAFPDNALESLEQRYGNDFPSLISFITGASRTADIEKTLVMGAHGPKELFVFINKNE
jgi:L-lactate dehydrogenase complex protein LldG